MDRTRLTAPARSASVRTTLAIESIEIPVGLFRAVAEPGGLLEFETAGPNGGPLRYQQRAVTARSDEETLEAAAAQDLDELARGVDNLRADPLADDPGPQRETEATAAIGGVGASPAVAVGESTMGEFRQVLVEQVEGKSEDAWPEITRDEVRRGVRVGDGGRFVDCTEQLAAIEERTRMERMEVVAFIDVGQVPRERVLASYYVAPSEPEGKRALRLLYEAMRSTRRAAVAKWTTRTRQACGVVVPFEHRASRQVGLMVLKLAWAEDVRAMPPTASLNDVMVADSIDGHSRMLGAAEELVRAWSDRRLALDELRDDAIALREELMARVVAGEMDPQVVGPEPEAEPMSDLQAALEASVEAARS